MARDDFDRRRLRSLYDRNRSRVAALADARDRRRGGDDSYAAPRRFIVSERSTHIEGFGRGGRQVRRVERRIVRTGDQPRPRRFSDGGIFRRGGRDRFRRAEDDDRQERRDRSRDNRDRREGRSLGSSRRTRLRMRSRRNGGGRRDDRREMEERRPRNPRRGGEGRRNNDNGNNNNNGGNRGGNNGGKNNNNNRNNSNNNNKNSRNNNNNGNNNNNSNRGGNKSQPRRTREPQMTREELDRQLESYHN